MTVASRLNPRRVLHFARRVIQGLENRALVLGYHRVNRQGLDPQWLTVTPEQFDQQMAHLRDHYQPISLDRLLQKMEGRSIPQRAVVVTFDDGYVDNLQEARPILEKYDIPATVFVSTGRLGGAREFWWDELEDLLLSSPEVAPSHPITQRPDDPATQRPNDLASPSPHHPITPSPTHGPLVLTIGGQKHRWEMADESTGTPSGSSDQTHWTVREKHDPTPRHRAYRQLCALLLQQPYQEQEEVLEQVARWTSRDRRVRPSHRLMTPEELLHLTDGGLISAGAHTVTHPLLPILPPPAQQWEIAESKRQLEDILGRPVRTFSYPYGGLSGYTAATVAAAQESGLDCACAVYDGLAAVRTDRFQVPRFLPRDWDGETFARTLHDWTTRYRWSPPSRIAPLERVR